MAHGSSAPNQESSDPRGPVVDFGAIDELVASMQAGDEGVTISEMADRYDRVPRTMRKLVAKWVEGGLLTRGRGTRANRVGVRRPVAVYRATGEQKEA